MTEGAPEGALDRFRSRASEPSYSLITDVRKWVLQTADNVVGDDIAAAITFARAERVRRRQAPAGKATRSR